MSTLVALRLSAVAAAGLALCGFSPTLADFTPASRLPAPPDRIAAASDAADRMTVPVFVQGQGPFPFVIDTGADRTVISRELADRLALKPGDKVSMNGVCGVDLTPTSRIDALKVGVRSLMDISAPTLSAANLGAMGMLGIDSLRDQRMVMDFQHNVMSVEASKREHFGTDVIVVHAKRRLGQLVLVDASIAGVPIFVILDSGAQNSIGNAALENLIQSRRNVRDVPAQVISVSGATMAAHFASLPRVKIGGFTVRNLPIAFADLHTFKEFDLEGQPAMLLGMDVLRRFDRVAVDFGRKEVSFRMPLDS